MLEALKADPATRDIPVVVVSIVDERARGVALGAAAYLVKPISREDLRAALTTVAFLPGSPAPAPRDGHSTEHRDGRMNGHTILVVEDNPKNLKLIKAVLEFSGFEVIEALSGEEGVRLAAEASPDLILMDLQLPGIDGAEALRQIRSTTVGPGVPVVAVTAFAMSDDRERAFASGFDGYVEKPISAVALPQQVRDFIELGGRT